MILGILVILIILSLLVFYIKKKNTVAILICLILTIAFTIFTIVYIKKIDTFRKHHEYNMNQTDVNMMVK